jgi:hypothetical protein
MQVTRIRQGEYRIAIYGFVFTLEKLYGSRNWTLYNSQGTEINQCEVKYGMLELMKDWSLEDAQQQNDQEFCTYA